MFDNHLECVVCTPRSWDKTNNRRSRYAFGRGSHAEFGSSRRCRFCWSCFVLSKHGRAITAIIPIRNTRGIDDVHLCTNECVMFVRFEFVRIRPVNFRENRFRLYRRRRLSGTSVSSISARTGSSTIFVGRPRQHYYNNIIRLQTKLLPSTHLLLFIPSRRRPGEIYRWTHVVEKRFDDNNGLWFFQVSMQYSMEVSFFVRSACATSVRRSIHRVEEIHWFSRRVGVIISYTRKVIEKVWKSSTFVRRGRNFKSISCTNTVFKWTKIANILLYFTGTYRTCTL